MERALLARPVSAADWYSHPDEQWTPVRYVREPQRCDFCWQTIRAGSPGTRTGERGTKAYYNATRRVWECLECRTEGTRVQMVLEHAP